MTVVRVALYARNSKPPKGWRPSYPGEEPPGSWRVQLERLRAEAKHQGYVVHLEAHDVVTGRNPNRPGWQRVLSAARGHHVHMVMVTKLDRVMRSVRHFCEVGEEFLALKVPLVFLDQRQADVVEGGAMATAFRGMASVFAQLEADLARERSGEVLERREDGRVYGPRSDKPAGRPREYGDGHTFRQRGGRLAHDPARCAACKAGRKGGLADSSENTPQTAGVPASASTRANPNGFAHTESAPSGPKEGI